MSGSGSGPLGFLSFFDPPHLKGPVSLVRSLYTDFGQISACGLSEKILADPRYGKGLRADLHTGLPTLPAWMQDIVRVLLTTDRPITPSRSRRVRAPAKPAARRTV